MLTAFKPEEAKDLAAKAADDFAGKWHLLQQMAAMQYGQAETPQPVASSK